MGFFGKIIKAGIDTVSLPVAIIKDVITMGSVLTDEKQLYTIRKLKDIGDDIQEAKDEL